MSFYSHLILPRLLNAAMSAKPIGRQREKVVPRAEGCVLEVGFGAGHNLPFYDASRVSRIWALEPAKEMRVRAAGRVAASPIPLEFLDLPGEQIPLEDGAADTVLVTYTLCTIPDVLAALRQMRRVLKPTGRLLFCEHGESPDENVRRWQRRLEPAWKAVGGGCHLSRAIPHLINESGFSIDAMESMYLPGTPRFAGFNYWGSARTR
ncbi:MAG TPA: class I SAM-dependent methyltransferase [Rhizomicrobium sp.]|jgi:ubiquinone/menaquinone biosynthesis C-methylase UbiE|nr:class I SAM-dependent methyltransferase [Rhizomicrobium sp.]